MTALHVIVGTIFAVLFFVIVFGVISIKQRQGKVVTKETNNG